MTILELLALSLIAIHFGTPLVYYWYMKTKYLNKPWNIMTDSNYKPKISIIIPTYNEAKIIVKRLNNLYSQDYPKDLMEVVVVDSASTDGTPKIVEEWSKDHNDLRLTLLREPMRRGMVPALNYALKRVSNDAEVVVFTDADAYWPRDALTKVAKYFADPNVGAVTVRITPLSEGEGSSEKVYRDYYNVLRVAESKVHSTPVHNAPLEAFRAHLILKIGLPEYTGNNDSTPASILAFMSYRAIQIDEVTVLELMRSQIRRKIRRAQHLLLNFLKTKSYVKKLGLYKHSSFENIWRAEWWLHVVNPWLLAISITSLLVSITLSGSLLALALLGAGLLLLASRTFRMWALQQLYLAIAAVRNLWTKEIVWNK